MAIFYSPSVLFCFSSLLLYICDVSFNWTLSFIPLLTSLSLSTNITYPSSFIIPKFHAAFSYISVKYFNSLPVSIKTSLFLSSSVSVASRYSQFNPYHIQVTIWYLHTNMNHFVNSFVLLPIQNNSNNL